MFQNNHKMTLRAKRTTADSKATTVMKVFNGDSENIEPPAAKRMNTTSTNPSTRVVLGELTNITAQNAAKVSKKAAVAVSDDKTALPMRVPIKKTSSSTVTELEKKPQLQTSKSSSNLIKQASKIPAPSKRVPLVSTKTEVAQPLQPVLAAKKLPTPMIDIEDVDKMEIDTTQEQSEDENIGENGDSEAELQEVYEESASTDVVEDIDENDEEDPQFCTDYVSNIFEYLKQKEIESVAKPDYMSRQVDISEKHRTVMVDWMAEVITKFKLLAETYFLSVQLVDRFLQSKVVSRSNLQLVGVTCMLIASKHEETYTPMVQDFVYITAKAYTTEDILNMERMILLTLDFNLNTPTPLHFLRRFSKAARSDSKIHTLSKYIIELSMLEYGILVYLPSMIASAAVYLARRMMQVTPPWTPTLEHYTGNTMTEVLSCAGLLNNVLKKQQLQPTAAIYKKYASPRYLSVATIPPLENF